MENFYKIFAFWSFIPNVILMALSYIVHDSEIKGILLGGQLTFLIEQIFCVAMLMRIYLCQRTDSTDN